LKQKKSLQKFVQVWKLIVHELIDQLKV